MKLATIFCSFLTLTVLENAFYTNGILLDGASTDEERFANLENEVQYLREALETLQSCTIDYCEVYWSKWSTWGAWSSCTGHCDGGYSSRSQTRQRQRTCINDPTNEENLCTGSSLETDSRPCNVVELYGCLSDNATSASSYGLAYNFYDELAQSTCTAALTSAAHAAAVRRDCSTGHAAACSTVCSSLGYTCFESLHVYKSFTPLQLNIQGHPDEGKQGLSMYRYFSCEYGGGCGPNYCCCKW